MNDLKFNKIIMIRYYLIVSLILVFIISILLKNIQFYLSLIFAHVIFFYLTEIKILEYNGGIKNGI